MFNGIKVTMYRYVKSSNDVFASSMSRAVSMMNNFYCCFITAWRTYKKPESNLVRYSKKEKRNRNKELEEDIKQSGLTFIRIEGGFVEGRGTEYESHQYEDTFLVVNNKFEDGDFIDLCVNWCNKYDQDEILITMPIHDSNNKNAISVVGERIDKNGNEIGSIYNVTMYKVAKVFSKMFGRTFVMESLNIHETSGYDIHTVAGLRSGISEFKRLYGN